MSELCQNRGILYNKGCNLTFALGHFFLSVTELRKMKSFSTYSHPIYLTLPQTFLQICMRVQDDYGLLSTTSQALSVQVRMLVRLLTFSH